MSRSSSSYGIENLQTKLQMQTFNALDLAPITYTGLRSVSRAKSKMNAIERPLMLSNTPKTSMMPNCYQRQKKTKDQTLQNASQMSRTIGFSPFEGDHESDNREPADEDMSMEFNGVSPHGCKWSTTTSMHFQSVDDHVCLSAGTSLDKDVSKGHHPADEFAIQSKHNHVNMTDSNMAESHAMLESSAWLEEGLILKQKDEYWKRQSRYQYKLRKNNLYLRCRLRALFLMTRVLHEWSRLIYEWSADHTDGCFASWNQGTKE